MTIVRYGWSILDRNSPHPELMQRMMERMAVNAITAMRMDGGMAWCEARTKCIFCRHEEECRHWLDGSEAPRGPHTMPSWASGGCIEEGADQFFGCRGAMREHPDRLWHN